MKPHSLPLSRKKNERSIFSSIFTALLAVLLIEAILLQVTLASSNVTQKLSQNALDILDKQVENRSSYINDQLSEIRELTDISTSINEATQELLDSGELDIDTIDQSSDNCLPLFNRIMPDLISALRSRPGQPASSSPSIPTVWMSAKLTRRFPVSTCATLIRTPHLRPGTRTFCWNARPPGW